MNLRGWRLLASPSSADTLHFVNIPIAPPAEIIVSAGFVVREP